MRWQLQTCIHAMALNLFFSSIFQLIIKQTPKIQISVLLCSKGLTTKTRLVSRRLQEANAWLRCVYFPIVKGKENIDRILEKLGDEGCGVPECFDTFSRVSIRRLRRLLPDARWVFRNGLDDESNEEELAQHIEEWDDWKTDEEDSESDFFCLFCDQKYTSVESVFEHCSSKHFFNFQSIKKTLGLNFYDSFKLINYIRSQVAENRCWTCRLALQSSNDLQKHLHEPTSLEETKLFLEDDKYLKPFIQEDSLLYNFWEDEDCEEDHTSFADRDEVMMELANNEDLGKIHFDDDDTMDIVSSKPSCMNENGSEEVSAESNGSLNMLRSLEKVKVSGTEAGEDIGSSRQNGKDKNLKVSFANVVAKEKKNVNANYFGAYGSYGIHKEMISDKVRMDAYRGAILDNPSLLNNATVLDVGCGTGILSMFAAQAGAARVIAVEASDKMAAVATQIAKDNGLLWGGSPHSTGVINVVQGMVEEIDKSVQIPPHSVDILISEWMGYCLLYETMLSSVLYARDRWLKPGGAILPDTATIFVAGFGRGGTSIPFWENVYGFNMSCISKEVVEDASQNPIVDVLDSRDIMTNTAVLQTFDLATMKEDEMDFTSSFELEPKLDLSMNQSTDLKSKTAWCYGVILWFETGFTSRFCKEKPTVLSTSPYGPKTHWSQTILTFQEPIAMSLEKPVADNQAMIGTDAHPAFRIQSRISIVRAAEHRSIDISLETSGISSDGRKHNWPVQIFNL